MKNYTLTKQAKGKKFLYQVIDENNMVISQRESARNYIACTVDCSLFFGREDLIGKGAHGLNINRSKNPETDSSVIVVKLNQEDMAGWSKSQGKQKLNKSEEMSKDENAEKAPKKVVKKTVKKVAAKTATKKEKAPKKEKAAKGPGVIASILEFVQAGPVKESKIVSQLVKRFPDRTEDSMTKTVKAQIGSNKRPVRMEREKGIEFVIVEDEKTKEKTYSVK